MRKSTLPLCAGLLALALSPLAVAQAPQLELPQDRRAGAAAIDTATMTQWLTTLASEEFGGRGTGQVGFRRAAEFVRDHFERLGLQPGGDNGDFWQRVPWERSRVDVTKSHLRIIKDDSEQLTLEANQLSGSVSADTDHRGQLAVIVVRRVSAPDEFPELADADVDDKIVLLYVDPEATGNDRRALARGMYRMRNRLRQRASSIITVTDGPVSGGLTGTSGRSGGNRATRGLRRRPASVTIGHDSLDKILAMAGVDASSIEDHACLVLQLQAELQVKVTQEDAPAFNVIGILPGSDDKLKDEYVVIGSHLDHLGRRGDRYYPGADDDGSGTTGVLAVASAFANNPVAPRRSVLFVTFCGEESGLVGSRYFVDHPPIPLDAIAAELQMDMIGRNEESQRSGEKAEDNTNTVHLVGTERLSRDLHEICIAKNDQHRFDIEWDEEDVFSRSDHANFARKGVPIAFFFTGFHRDYHQPTDTVDKINFDKLARIATWVYDIAFELATRDARPLVDEDLWAENRGRLRGPEKPAAPVRPK